MERPVIVCHMITSIDGRLLPERWPCPEATLASLYESTAERLGADGWMVGRRTMEEWLASGEPALSDEAVGQEDRIADRGRGGLAIAFDRTGRLRPRTGEIEGDHLVLVLSERVGEAHVDTLVSQGVSVVFAGATGEDLRGAISRIGTAFGVRRLLLEGGGRLNGAFLAADLIDETSTLVFPVVDGQRDVPAIFDCPTEGAVRPLDLISSDALDDGTVWLRHRVRRG